MSKQKKLTKKTPKVHKDLEGFNIEIDKFGEIKGNINIDKINAFLDKKLEDKKLKNK